jgi:hypothetical protein
VLQALEMLVIQGVEQAGSRNLLSQETASSFWQSEEDVRPAVATNEIIAQRRNTFSLVTEKFCSSGKLFE